MRTARVVLLVCGVAVISCGSPMSTPSRDQLSASSSRALDSVVQATGNGKVRIDGELRTFAFTAVRHSNVPPEDFTATGEAQLFTRPFFIAHAEIICMKVMGNQAWIGGIITGHHFCSGTNFMFHVEDNGERNGDPPDMLSLAAVCDAPGPELPLAYCATGSAPYPLPEFPVEEGSIVVHQ